VRRTITIFTFLLLASTLGISEACAYGGGGFYGSGRGTEFNGDKHSGVSDGKFRRHPHELHRTASLPDY
jgi:hypothetical protein